MDCKYFVLVAVVVFGAVLCNGVYGRGGDYEENKCGENVTWDLVDGVLTISGEGEMYGFDDYYNPVPWKSVRNEIEEVVIENGVTSIGGFAFKYCKSLKSVTIASSVETIGDESFLGSNVSNLVIPEGVTEINNAAFYYCDNLTTVTLPGSLITIGQQAFSRTGLKTVTIPDSVTTIKSYAFDGCIYLESVTLSKNLTEIGEFTFNYCMALKEIVIPDGVITIGGKAFDYCTSLKSVSIPDSVKSIEAYAFFACDLENLTIPDSVTSIADGAFKSCTDLKRVFYQGSVEITSDAFTECTNLDTICVPNSYTPDEFCGKEKTPDAEECVSFRELFVPCFKGDYIDGQCVKVKTREAREWEKKTSECGEYKCIDDNGSEEFYAESLCNYTDKGRQVCFSGECIQNWEESFYGWIVELGLDGVVFDGKLDIDGVVANISKLSEVSADEMTAGVATRDDGFIHFIYLEIDSESYTEKVVDALGKAVYSQDCQYGVLCKVVSISHWMRAVSSDSSSGSSSESHTSGSLTSESSSSGSHTSESSSSGSHPSGSVSEATSIHDVTMKAILFVAAVIMMMAFYQ